MLFVIFALFVGNVATCKGHRKGWLGLAAIEMGQGWRAVFRESICPPAIAVIVAALKPALD
jgi:hypothetical protein